MKYKIMAAMLMLIMIGAMSVFSGGESPSYLRNSFSTIEEFKEWVQSPDQTGSKYSLNEFGAVAEYIQNKGIPIPIINGYENDSILTNIFLYKELYSVKQGCGIEYFLKYNSANSSNISIMIEIILDENKELTQGGVLEYLKNVGAVQNFYEHKTAVFNGYGCSVNCSIMHDKLERLNIGGHEQDVLIRTYETGWGGPAGNRIIFIYNDFCVTIYNLDDFNILKNLSVQAEPL